MSGSSMKFVLVHPNNVAKIVKSPSISQKTPLSSSRKKLTEISVEQQNKIIFKIKQRQSNKLQQLKEKLKQKTQQNKLYAQSLSHYHPDDQLNTLQSQLDQILAEHTEINSQILNCQIVQKNTTPEQYYLFKKKQRMDSFNESIDQLYNHVSQQKNNYNTFILNCKHQIKQLTSEIKHLQSNINKTQKSLYSKQNHQNQLTIPDSKNYPNRKNTQFKNTFQDQDQNEDSVIQQMKIDDDNDQNEQHYKVSNKKQQQKLGFSLFQMPKLQFSLRDNIFTNQDQKSQKSQKNSHSPNSPHSPNSLKKKLQSSANKLNNMKIPMTESINHHLQKQEQIQQQQSPLESSVDQEQYYMLKQEYSNLLSTVQIISQNKEILTAQLFDRVININNSLNSFFQNERTKIFKQIKEIKADLADPKKFANPTSMSVVQPTLSQLAYNIKPLIQDYSNKMNQISKKLTPELKQIAKQLLVQLNWSSLNIQSYFQKEVIGTTKQSSLSKEEEMIRLQQTSKQLQQQIKAYQISLKEVMEETVTYKQKQHELEMGMNNMRKMLQ